MVVRPPACRSVVDGDAASSGNGPSSKVGAGASCGVPLLVPGPVPPDRMPPVPLPIPASAPALRLARLPSAVERCVRAVSISRDSATASERGATSVTGKPASRAMNTTPAPSAARHAMYGLYPSADTTSATTTCTGGGGGRCPAMPPPTLPAVVSTTSAAAEGDASVPPLPDGAMVPCSATFTTTGPPNMRVAGARAASHASISSMLAPAPGADRPAAAAPLVVDGGVRVVRARAVDARKSPICGSATS